MAETIKNIYLFTWWEKKWVEKFLLDQELDRRTSAFSDKFWADAISIFNSENWDDWAAKQSIFWWWLFSTRKLTIIKWLPTSTERSTWFTADTIENFVEYFIKNAEIIPADNLVVFVSYTPDRRGRLFKFLKDKCNYKEFEKKTPFELKAYTQKELWDIKISDSNATFLIDRVWDDLYRLSSEIDKLKEYCNIHNIKTIDEKIIETICVWLTETEVFWFMNILLKDKKAAISYLTEIENSWVHWNEFAWALYYQLKVNIAINKCYEKWIKDNKIIAKWCWATPWAIFMNLKSIDQILKNWIALENMYKWLIQTEISIKNWKLNEEAFWLNVKKLSMDFTA